MKKFTFKSTLRASALLALALSLPLLSGCSDEFLLFKPKGEIGEATSSLISLSFWVMMIVVIPVIIMTIWFPIQYRSSNKKAKYDPDWEHSNKIEFWVWSIPCLIIIWLGIITYQTSHSLDPRKPIESDKETMRIHVVAMDWKWLFIYPEQEIATINEVAFPKDTPVEFLITSDTVMNSFFIPQLGSQIYAMAGMENQLHLIGNEVGVYRGLSANYSGFGFSGMKFKAHVVEDADFNTWVNKVKSVNKPLTSERYTELTKKTKDNPVEYFSTVSPLMFTDIVESYRPQSPSALKKQQERLRDNAEKHKEHTEHTEHSNTSTVGAH